MFLRLVDENEFKSPILDIHSDEKEFLKQIELWKSHLLIWAKRTSLIGTPLGRLDVNTCIVDLLRHLTSYYVLSSPHCEGRITMTFRLVNEDYAKGSEITEVKIYE